MVEPNNTAKTGDFRYGLVFLQQPVLRLRCFPAHRELVRAEKLAQRSGRAEEGEQPSIQGLTAEDTLRVDVKGANFFLHINDQAIGQVGDANRHRRSRLFVETLDDRVHIHFGTTTIREVKTTCFNRCAFWDDFTDPKSGWPNNLEFGNYYIGYHEPNHYHVEVHVPHDSAVVAVPKRSFTDFTMESKVVVAPNNTAKTGDFRYGLVYRRSGNQYYAFVVSPRRELVRAESFAQQSGRAEDRQQRFNPGLDG